MKTIDEVIIALEVCTSGYCSHPKHGDCPYLDERNDCDTRQRKLDALHYLKEYRDKHDEMLKLEEALGYCEMAENRPLTWDELRTMEGKPIWVEYEGYTPGWEIVENNGAVRGSAGDFTGRFVETNMSILRKEEQGKTWQAYRKERE